MSIAEGLHVKYPNLQKKEKVHSPVQTTLYFMVSGEIIITIQNCLKKANGDITARQFFYGIYGPELLF